MAVAISRTANPAGAGTGTTITYSTQAIGAAANNRIVAVMVGVEVASASPNSATINYGTGALPMRGTTIGTTGSMFTRIFYLDAPTGTTADIAITFGASVAATTHHISVYRITDGIAVAQGGVGDTDADPISSTAFQIPNGGGAIGVCADADAATARTWTGLTEDLDETTTAFRYSTGTSTTAGSTTITVSGGNNEDGALSWLAFMPSYVVQALSEPVRQKISPALAIALGASGLIAPPMSLPVHRSITAETGAYTINIADVITFSEDGGSGISWLAPLSEPQRLPSGIKPHLQQSFVTNIAPPAPAVQWWVSPLSEPVRATPQPITAAQSALAYVPAATQNAPNNNFAEQSLFSKYSFPWNEPVRQKQGLTPGLQQTLSVNPSTPGAFSISLDTGSYVISIADEITFSGFDSTGLEWFAPLSEPVRYAPSRRHLYQSFDADAWRRAATDIRWWFAPLSEPVRQKPGIRPDLQQSLLANSFFPSGFYISLDAGHYTISIADEITFSGLDSTNFEWFRPLSEPVRRKPITAHLYQYFTANVFPITGGTNYSIEIETGAYTINGAPSEFIFDNEGWRTQFSEPVRAKAGLQKHLQPTTTAPVFVPPAPISFGWFSRLSEPVRLNVFRTALQQTFATDPKPPRVDGRLWWLTPFTEPVRSKPRLATHHHQALAYVGAATQNAPNNNFAEQSYFSKYAYPWSEPVRQKPGLKPGLQQAYTNDYILIPIPPEPRAYMLPLSEPVRKLEGLKWYLQQTTALPPRLLPTPDVTGVLDAVEINGDVALIGISVYDGGVPGATASAQVSIIEIQAGVSSGGAFTARVSVVEVPPETATATVSIIEIVAADGSVSIQEV
jgi:hypothetical protein